MDDGLAAMFFSMNNFSKAHVALSAAKSAFEAACDAFDKASEEEEEVEVDEPALEELSGRVAGIMPPFLEFLEALAAYWFLVPGVCAHLLISGELTSVDRLQVTEYGLATALIMLWHRSTIPPLRLPSETRRGGRIAWALSPESLEKYIMTMFVMVLELSRLTGPVRGSVFGTMPAEHTFSLVRRLSGTDQRAETLENSFEKSILRVVYRRKLGVPPRVDHGRKREACEDVPFDPLPEGFLHTPFGTVLSQVMGAMWASGLDMCEVVGLPAPDKETPKYLHDMVTCPDAAHRWAITTRNERFVSIAALNQRKFFTSGARLRACGQG